MDGDNPTIYRIEQIGRKLKSRAAILISIPDRPTLLDGDVVEFVRINSKGKVKGRGRYRVSVNDWKEGIKDG